MKMTLKNKITGIENKIEKIVGPASMALTFGQPLIDGYWAGGANGIIDVVKDTVRTWHPPTIEGFTNALGGDLGKSVINSMLARGIEYLGGALGVPIVTKGGRLIRQAADGATAGGFAKMLAFPTLYNPHGVSIGGGRQLAARGEAVADPRGVLKHSAMNPR